ncbi:MAG: M14 family metallopeptidase [Planctomycetota bacterium]
MSRLPSVFLLVALALAWFAPALPAQDLPSPADYLGWQPGERYTAHHLVVGYLDELDRRSDRVRVVRYGRTNEDRELVLAFVTSAENQARLEELRLRMEKIADPRRLAEGETAADLIADQPVFVWMSYCVHGNETSCTEAALQLVHDLAAAATEEGRKLLQDAVVIVDPCVNPDGRDRYVNWFNGVVGRRGDPHPAAMEHDEPWPGGRFNHYGFDLNRDWAFASQIETRSRLKQFVRWHPQVHGDFHEMGHDSSYFFFPAELPVNANLPPYTLEWGEIFGRGNAAAFDARGWAYYTAESFDLFYPGYGDSWPSFTGAIGMTYEQAGHSSSGLAVEREDGEILTLEDRIEHHLVASKATIGTAAARRAELLRDYQRFRESAIEEGRGGEVREFILEPGADSERTARLVELLLAQGIEVRRATTGFRVPTAVDFQGGRSDRQFAAGTYLVSLAQPLKRLAKTLLEPRTEIRELFFYDVSAWSLPYAFGVTAHWSPLAVEVAAEPVLEVPRSTGAVEEGDATYGYLLRWDRIATIRATLRLFERDVVVRSAGKSFTMQGREWPRGTVFVARGGNPRNLDAIVAEVATETGATFVPVKTGMSEKGIDLGSDNVTRLRPTRVALVGGEGVSATSFGAARFLLEELYDVPHSVIALSSLGRADLSGFGAIIFPDVFGDPGERTITALREFVRDGGVVVAWDAAARSLGAEGAKLSGISTRDEAEEEKRKQEREKEKDEKPRRIEQREEEDRRRSAPGSIFRVELDPAHPLSFGYGDEIVVFKGGTRTFDPHSGLAIGLFRDAPRLSGYLDEETDKRMRGRGYAMVERQGRGSVVFFAEDPNFRSAWHGLSRLLLNAIILLPRN